MGQAEPGYEVRTDILTPDEVAQLASAIGRVRDRSRAGVRHLMGHPPVAELAGDPRLLAFARSALGTSAVPYRATLFDKSPGSNWLVVWHQDTALPIRVRHEAPGWGPWSVKAGILYAHAPATALERVVALRVHLNDSLSDNGPLRVLPGSHTMGVLSDAEIRSAVDAGQPRECVVGRGGVVMMRPLLVHASSKSMVDAPRRVLHIEYAVSLDLEPGLELAVA
jgi:ectoine hydroxylase-related dioxygenase (phytanoyl-CoA dioxygenase family)